VQPSWARNQFRLDLLLMRVSEEQRSRSTQHKIDKGQTKDRQRTDKRNIWQPPASRDKFQPCTVSYDFCVPCA
jgi:hypothetical protein